MLRSLLNQVTGRAARSGTRTTGPTSARRGTRGAKDEAIGRGVRGLLSRLRR